MYPIYTASSNRRSNWIEVNSLCSVLENHRSDGRRFRWANCIDRRTEAGVAAAKSFSGTRPTSPDSHRGPGAVRDGK